MNSVKVNKNDLMVKVQENREAHQKVYTEAMVNYRTALTAELLAKLQAVETGQEIEHTLDLVKPAEHLKEYDRVLAMLEMSIDQEIVLQAHEFAAYVMDQWSWRGTWAASNVSYIGSLFGKDRLGFTGSAGKP